MRHAPFFLLALLLTCGAARADDAPPKAKAEPTLQETLAAFFAEPDAQKRAAAGFAIAVKHPDAAQVAAAVATARTWPKDAKKDDVVVWKRSVGDGVENTVLAAIPEAYDAAKAWPVLIWLHGGVARDGDGGGASGIRGLGQLAAEEGFLLLAPSSRKGSEWWTPAGTRLVRGALDDLKRRYRVDADRVAVAGFSDGASGCLHLLAHDPEPYACFLALMAHPGVTRLAGGPSFAVNVRSRPVFAVNGGKDRLYPSAQIEPMIDQLKDAGCKLTWLDLPDAGHNMTAVFPDHWDKLRDFWAANTRTPLPKQIAWETALPRSEGRLGWVEVLTVDPKAPSAKGAVAATLPDPAGRPVLGIRIDMEFEGPGLRVTNVEDDSAAADAGFEIGDVIIAVQGTDLEGPTQGRTVLMRELPKMAATKKAGVFKVQRGDEQLELTCLPRAAGAGAVKRPKELGYGMPSARIEAKVSDGNRIDVNTRHVGSFKLHLADGLVNLAQPLKVYVNGVLKFEGLAKGSTGYVLQEAVRGGAGAPLYRASVVVKP